MPNPPMITESWWAYRYLRDVTDCPYWVFLPFEEPYRGPVELKTGDIIRHSETGVEILRYVLEDGMVVEKAHRLNDEYRTRFWWEHGQAIL